LSKIETGQLILNYSDFDINQLMKDLEEVTLNELKKKEKRKIDLLVEMDVKKENFFIRSDESRLRQVLNNLIQNAVKFTHKGHIVIGYKVKEKELLFYVKDTGIGINQADKEIVFERFNQSKDVIRKHMGGTGLGLSISKEIINRMKGKIWVESEHNKGAEFYFTIPLIDVAHSTFSHVGVKENDLAVKYNWSGKRILIVEDSPIAYELLIKLLNITKAEFILAEDGQSAIEKVKKDHNIDLVLMDIQLPYLDGYQTTEKIKEFRPELPVVAQTANAMSDDRKRCLTAGCNDYLAKPIDRQELLEKIDKLLS
jgi:CheY-like chemotaxis protein